MNIALLAGMPLVMESRSSNVGKAEDGCFS